MGMPFNADEVFEMAEQIERNGARFYREAAAQAPDRTTKEMFLNLAAMEDGHLHTFQQMRQGLSDPEKGGTVFDPDNEAALYLQAMADTKGFEGMKSPTLKLTGKESVQELLQIAIEAEKNSVLFYVGLRAMVPARAGTDKVDAIIREEVSHAAQLRRQLAAIRGQ
ncbi:MAG: ferritin family protein [Sedimentisphaerales bacterium]|nr:ferritin family protein [Sedimentisphaerales bacterium]